jgi:hypothetical protein
MSTTKPLPEFFIGKAEANKLITNFMKTKLPGLNKKMPNGREDTQSIWYSFSHIEELYKEMVFLNADGLRIYFGCYDGDTKDTEYGDDVSQQLCLVMVPTMTNLETAKHEDILQEDTKEFWLRPGSEMFVGNDGNNAELTHAGSRGYNHGSPCPPICKDQTALFPL